MITSRPSTSPMTFSASISVALLRRLATMARLASERLRIGRRHFQSAHVGRDDHGVGELLRPQIADEHRRREKVIHRDVEKPGDLLRVQIHRQHAIDAGGGEQIGDELRGDRHARLVFAILPGVAEERDDRRDPRRARPPRRIHHDEQLHQVLIRRRTGRLDDENIAPADVVVDLDERFAVRKRTHRRIPERHARRRRKCAARAGDAPSRRKSSFRSGSETFLEKREGDSRGRRGKTNGKSRSLRAAYRASAGAS